ncbi:uncharacterized protein LOC122277451 [Carya illinoinensis]|uniref:Uncharacterized protein n=1 Tax=Carya illinoinensis TaxID=32201 RepID=A0A8T1PS53_CARIL|nr:uncharacterized protein LOC122277451 [Carya illinoinensis]KAG6643140.1 hypothetical protein CIPAW_09G189700 [Carya illinoinensis]KAG6697293.1 hypothetical protein I3842_09G191600 [Carya illinoinensis]
MFLFTAIFTHLTSSSRWPFLVYAATWTAILTVVVAVASFAPEVAFVSAISSSSFFSTACETDGSVRMPLDVPGETLCLPANLFSRSKIDFIVPPVFAAVVVAASACLVRATFVWDDDETH